MWADTKQLLILKFLTTHLEGITGIDVQARDSDGQPEVTSNGTPVLVQKGLAGRVYRGRSLFGAEESDPFLVILEGVRPDQMPQTVGYDLTVRQEAWALLVQGFMEDDPANPLDNLYRLKGATEQRLAQIIQTDRMTDSPQYPDIYMMGGLIEDMQIGPGVVYPMNPQSGGGVEAFYLPVIVTFAMNAADPYAA